MMLSLLLQINEEPSVKGKSGSDLDEALVSKLKEHQEKLKKRSAEIRINIARLEDEQRKKITSEGLREGFSSGVS